MAENSMMQAAEVTDLLAVEGGCCHMERGYDSCGGGFEHRGGYDNCSRGGERGGRGHGSDDYCGNGYNRGHGSSHGPIHVFET